MNIHEYQAKALFEKFGVATTRGAVARSLAEVGAALDSLPPGPVVVKAQIHAGGRGKGTFTDGFKGGVKVCASRLEAENAARCMLGNTLVTAQTGPHGRMVRALYFSEVSPIAKEYYLAVLLDRAAGRPVIVASTEGGVEIEKVARETPHLIHKVHVDPGYGLGDWQVRRLAFGLGFAGDTLKHALRLIPALYRMWWECDATLVEINPLIRTPEGALLALDAKVAFDDNALDRHPDLAALRDLGEEDPKETEAARHGLNYITLDGTIACLVNGAGLAMSTMDIIQHFGGRPANFLDVGGGASREQVAAAFKIILTDPNVRGILVNIFGGIMDCDVIAHGVVDAARETGLAVPLVVRLEGNNVEAGRRTLAASGLRIESGASMADAARRVVELAA